MIASTLVLQAGLDLFDPLDNLISVTSIATELAHERETFALSQFGFKSVFISGL